MTERMGGDFIGSTLVHLSTGVDFVNTNDDAYFNQHLTINITDVKIYKSQTSYALNDHLLHVQSDMLEVHHS